MKSTRAAFLGLLLTGAAWAQTQPTTTTLATSPANQTTATFGSSVTFTATLRITTTGGAVTSGKVTFYDGATPLGVAGPPNGSGVVTFTTKLSAGAHTAISAHYQGNGTFSASTSSALSIAIVNVSSGGLGNLTTYTPPTPPSDLIKADFNGDGITDIATVNSRSSGGSTVGVFLGNGTAGVGNGTFAAAITPAPVTGNGSQGIAAGDFNEDGKVDLVVSNFTDGTVSILLGNGDGTFAAATTASVGQGPQKVAVGDFNGDGHMDIIASNGLDNTIGVLLGTGTGTFGTVITSTSNIALSNPYGIALADFNNDGITDVVIASRNNSRLIILSGTGNGSFSSTPLFTSALTSGATPQTVLIAPMISGDTDIIVGDVSSNRVLFFPYSPTNGFGAEVDIRVTPANVYGLAVADINGDGNLDIIAAGNISAGPNFVQILQGSGTGAFTNFQTTSLSLNSSADPFAIVAGDFNGDGRADIAIADGNLGQLDIATGLLPSSIGVTSTPNPATYGGTLTLTANLTPSTGPTGAVQFFIDNAPVGAPVIITAAPLQTTVAAPAAGIHSISAAYSGDSAYGPSLSTAVNETVNPEASTVSVTGSPNPSSATFGFTATATVTTGATGTVTFYQNSVTPSNNIGQGTLNNSNPNTASASIGLLPHGTTPIIAVYSGDANFSGSTSSAFNETTLYDSLTNLYSSQNPSTSGKTIRLTAVVSSNQQTPITGTITFQAGSTTLGTVTLVNGVASLTASFTGQTSITATYSGDSNFVSSGANITQNVGPATTTTLTGVTPSTINLGQVATLTATVSQTAGLGTETVTFYDGTTPLGTAQIRGGTATLSTPMLGPGRQSLTARFNGDSAFGPSVSAPFSQTVSAATQQGFQAATTTTIGQGTIGVALADINNDGKQDIVVLTGGQASGFVVLNGNGSGGFSNPSSVFATEGVPNAVAIADLNQDGVPDVVMATTAGIEWFINSATSPGNFTSSYQLPYSQGISLAVADYNQDGVPDLILSGNGFVQYIQGFNGSDGFTFQPAQTFFAPSGPSLVVAGDFNNDGIPDVAATDGGSSTANVAVLLGNGDGTFASPLFNNPAPGVASIATGDLDGDGNADLLVGTGAGIAVLFGDGTGHFPNGGVSTTTNSSFSVFTGDFNGDGLLDIGVTDASNPGFEVLLNTGSRTFGPPTVYGLASAPLTNGSVAVGNFFGGTGRSDIVFGYGSQDIGIVLDRQITLLSSTTSLTTSPNPSGLGNAVLLTATVTTGATGSVTFYLNSVSPSNSLGTAPLNRANPNFAALNSPAFPLGQSQVIAVYSGDTNYATSTSSPVTQTVLQTTTTSLSATPNPASVGQTIQLTAFVTPSSNGLPTGTVQFLVNGSPLGGPATLGNGSASTTASFAATGSESVTAVYSGDSTFLTSTSTAVSENIGSASSTTLSLSGSALFGVPYSIGATVTPTPTGSSPARVTFFDGARVLGTANVLLSSGTATLSTPLLAQGKRSLRAQFLGSQTLGPSVSAVVTNTVNSLPQQGFQTATTLTTGYGTIATAVGDFNNDGKDDVAAAVTNSTSFNGVQIALGAGGGAFQTPISAPTTLPATALAVADMDGNGYQDLVVLTGAGVEVILNQGNATFAASLVTPAPTGLSIGVADFNSDGIPDVMVTSSTGAWILTGRGNGTFNPPQLVLSTASTAYAIVADFNNDAKPDLAVIDTGATTNNLIILLGNGNGTFQSPLRSTPAATLLSFASADFNNDGSADLVLSNGSSLVLVLLGNGNGTFQTPASYGTTNPVLYVATGDFNGDGVIDIAASDAASPNIETLLGSGNTFGAASLWPITSAPSFNTISVGSFSGNGRADIAVGYTTAPGNIGILQGALAVPTLSCPSTTAQIPVGTPYTLSCSATGGVSPYLYSISSGSLPPGLSFSSTAGSLTGAPTTAGQYTFTMTAADSDSPVQSASATRTITVVTVMTLATPPLTPAVLNTAYNVTLISGGTAPYTCGVTNGSVPTGLTLNSATCVLSGTPTIPGSYSFTVGVSDNGAPQQNASQAYTLVVASPTQTSLSSSANPVYTGVLVTFTATVTGSGSQPTGTVQFKDGSTALGGPVNLVNGSASFTTSTLAAGSHAIVAVYNGDANHAGSVSALIGSPLNFFAPTPGSIADLAGQGTGFTARLSGTGTAFGGNDPNLTLNTAAGNLTLRTTASDLNGQNNVAQAEFLGVPLSSVGIGLTSDFTITATFNNIQYSQADDQMGLFAGQNSTTAFRGGAIFVPAGSEGYTVQTQNSVDANIQQSPPTAPVAGDNVVYTLARTSGTWTFQVADMTTPARSGSIAVTQPTYLNGQALVAGVFAQNTGNTTVKTETIGSFVIGTPNQVVVTNPFAPTTTTLTSSPNPSTPGQSVTLQATVSPSTATGTVRFLDGTTSLGQATLTKGVATLSAPLAAGTHSLTAVYGGDKADAGSTSAVLSQSVSSPTPSLTINTSSLPTGTVGQPYSASLTASGGSGGYSWSGSVPQGLSLSSSGSISGTPLAASNGTLQFVVSDSSGHIAIANLGLTINAAPVVISGNSSLGDFATGASVAGSFTASGGVPPYKWALSGAPGLGVDSSGNVRGSASQAGSFTPTLTVTDSIGTTSSQTLSFAVLGITGSVGGGTTTSAYSGSATGVGGVPPYSYAWSGLPGGISASGGALSGTAQNPGTYTVAVQVTDSHGISVSATFSIQISGTAPAALTVTTTSLVDGFVSQPYSQTLTASGGSPGYTWALSGGQMPAGLSLTSAGTVVGTPTAPGSYQFGVTATDTAGAQAPGTISLNIQPAPLQITSGSMLPAGMTGVDYPAQILGASGGTPPFTFSVKGSLPPGLSLVNGQLSGRPTAAGPFGFTLIVTDSAANPATASLAVTGNVRSPAADLVLSAATASFAITSGTSAAPPPVTVVVSSTEVSQVLSFSASTSTPWLSLGGATTTPGSISISLNNAALGQSAIGSPYSGTVTVTCTSQSCAGSSQTINVSLTVTNSPAQLTLGSPLLSFVASATNPQSSSAALSIVNTGGGSLTINSVTAADSWISIGSFPSSVAPGPGASVTITASPGSLRPEYYLSSITVNTSAGSATIPVTLLISSSSLMTLGPAGTQFSMTKGGAVGNPNGSFLVSVATGTAAFTATVMPGAPWLSGGGSGSASPSSPGTVSFSIDPAASAALDTGAYYGTIRVAGSGIFNSPQDFQVVLNVSPAGTPVIPNPAPAGLVFITAADKAVPAQNITLYASSKTSIQYQVAASPINGIGWLSVTQATGYTSALNPALVPVNVNAAGLKSGVYRGTVSFTFGTDIRSVNITLIVEGSFTGSAITGLAPRDTTVCSGAQLVPTQTGLVSNFSAPASWPTPLTIQLSDTCGNNINGAQVVTTFSNGDPPLVLTAVDSTSGIYSGTWTPRKSSAQLTILARAAAPGFTTSTLQIAGQVAPNAAPVLAPNGTYDVFHPQVGAGLGPGNIVQIYGSSLANQATSPSVLPLPTQVNGTQVLIGGEQAPLYYVSPGQINAQIPFDLAAGNQYQVIVSANGALTTPQPIQLTTAVPAILQFTSGSVVAQHQDGSLIGPSSPATPGENVVIYLTGLGATDIPVPSGAPSPSNPPANVLDTPVVTLNNVQIPIAFAGLTPTLVGLYQINFQIPASLPNGQYQLAISQDGTVSNTTLLQVSQ